MQKVHVTIICEQSTTTSNENGGMQNHDWSLYQKSQAIGQSREN